MGSSALETTAAMDTARTSLFLHPAALGAHREPPRGDEPEEPVPSGWHESSYELRCGLIVVEDPPAGDAAGWPRGPRAT